MSDITSPPDASPGEESGEHSELVLVIRDSERFLVSLLTDLTDVSATPELLRGRIAPVREEVGRTANALIVQIQSGEYTEGLRIHSLVEGDPVWRFKYLGYVGARHRFRERVRARPATDEGSLRDNLRWAKRPLQWLNVILGSLADVIPLAGAYKELKESTEAGVDEVLETEL